MSYNWSLSLSREICNEERLVIENCSLLYSPTPAKGWGLEGEKAQKRHFRLWGFISYKGSGVADCGDFYVFFFILGNSLIFLFAF